jgi:hypothetical protein
MIWSSNGTSGCAGSARSMNYNSRLASPRIGRIDRTPSA